MTMATQRQGGGGYVERGGGGSSGLADVVELILDKGLVIDVFVRVGLIGIEILTIDARVVVASVDTYLRFAEATGRLDMYGKGRPQQLGDLVQNMTEGGARGKTSGMLDAAAEKVGEILESGGRRREPEEQPRRRPREEAPRSRERAE